MTNETKRGKWTTITVRRATCERLRKLGRFGENWDDLLNRLVDGYEAKESG